MEVKLEQPAQHSAAEEGGEQKQHTEGDCSTKEEDSRDEKEGADETAKEEQQRRKDKSTEAEVEENKRPSDDVILNKEEEEEEMETFLKDSVDRPAVFEARLTLSEQRKREGNDLFAEKQFHEALVKYRHGLYQIYFDEMSFNFELLDEHRNMVNQAQLPLLLNALQCVLQLLTEAEQHAMEGATIQKQAGKEKGADQDETSSPLGEVTDENLADLAFKCAEQALKIDQQNAKALFRRGKLHFLKNDFEKAKKDFIDAAKYQPKDRSIRQYLQMAAGEVKRERAVAESFLRARLDKAFKSHSELTQPSKASSATDNDNSTDPGMISVAINCCSRLSGYLASVLNPRSPEKQKAS